MLSCPSHFYNTALLLLITFCHKADCKSGHSGGDGDLEQAVSLVFQRAWSHLGTALTAVMNTKLEQAHVGTILVLP